MHIYYWPHPWMRPFCVFLFSKQKLSRDEKTFLEVYKR